ncbi:hypothetical protein HAX54_025562 [Datura stramonium]|uniref:Uncharacterized protein n=1 Tax=Datura stramonium TaxID=4076 RepID=A0ABS8S6B3_DATST|nr:hypothetical protein [Datura stramonium]
MNKFPIYPNYEGGNYCGYEFDPQTDFTDFLTEARKHVSEGKFGATPPRSVELRNKKFENNVKKTCKKSWKSSLFSWLKTDKKKKNQGSRETSKGSTINKPKRGCVSGPMPGISGPDAIAGRPNKPLSGPLTSLFSPMNRVDNEIPYLCLNKVKDRTPGVQSYGPVYLVT